MMRWEWFHFQNNHYNSTPAYITKKSIIIKMDLANTNTTQKLSMATIYTAKGNPSVFWWKIGHFDYSLISEIKKRLEKISPESAVKIISNLKMIDFFGIFSSSMFLSMNIIIYSNILSCCNCLWFRWFRESGWYVVCRWKGIPIPKVEKQCYLALQPAASTFHVSCLTICQSTYYAWMYKY